MHQRSGDRSNVRDAVGGRRDNRRRLTGAEHRHFVLATPEFVRLAEGLEYPLDGVPVGTTVILVVRRRIRSRWNREVHWYDIASLRDFRRGDLPVVLPRGVASSNSSRWYGSTE